MAQTKDSRMTDTTLTKTHDVVVVGGGQAGLAIGHHLAQQGFDFTILEAAAEPAAAWRERWDSLKLFTPGRYDALPGLSAAGLTTVALTLADDATDIESAVAGLDKVALVLGSEGHGLSARWEASADRRAVIPMRAGIDSLNVAAATAVACYVAARR